MAQLTFRAERYGVPTENHFKKIKVAGRSGFTPNPPYNPAEPSSPNEAAYQKLVDEYQRWRLEGFTTRGLVDLDCITERELDPNDLENPIFEPWERRHWDSSGDLRHSLKLYPVSDEIKAIIGMEGQPMEWTVDNDRIWAVLEPALKLGTRILENMVDHPWFDAMLLADREEIPSVRFPPGALSEKTLRELQNEYKTFKLRSVEERNSGTGCRKRFQELVKKVFNLRLSLGISDINEDPTEGGESATSAPAEARLIFRVNPHDIKIYLAWIALAPLLNPSINSGERLMETWNIAVSMVHETMHALNYARCGFTGKDKPAVEIDISDPYFAQESFAELGSSSEVAIYGGIVHAASEHSEEWQKVPDVSFPPKRPGIDDLGKPILINPGPPKDHFKIPIPVTYYERVNSHQYWEVHVRKFGIDGALKPPKVVDGLWFQDVPGPGNQTWYDIYDSEKNKREMLEAFSIQVLKGMNETQRAQHAIVMRREMVAKFQPLIRQRDEIVNEVLESVDHLSSMDPSHDNYSYQLKEMGNAIDNLMQTHVNMWNKLEKEESTIGTIVTATKQNIFYFQKSFVQFVDNIVPYFGAAVLKQAGVKDFQEELRTTTIALHTTGPPADDLAEKEILGAYNLHRQGKDAEAEKLCISATARLECLSYTRILANFLMAYVLTHHLSKLHCLRVAIKSYQALNKTQIPAQFQAPLHHFDQRSVAYLTSLEVKEKATSRHSCR